MPADSFVTFICFQIKLKIYPTKYDDSLNPEPITACFPSFNFLRNDCVLKRRKSIDADIDISEKPLIFDRHKHGHKNKTRNHKNPAPSKLPSWTLLQKEKP